MRYAIGVCAATLTLCVGAGAAQHASAWRFVPDAGTRVAKGGPQAAWVLEDGTTLIGICSRTTGPLLYESKNGLFFRRTEGGGICDPAVQLRDGTWRAYHVRGGARPGLDRILSMRSQDGRHFRAEPGVRIQEGGFGVPMAVRLTSGDIRLYWVGPNDAVVSARSKDGLRFTPEAGQRFPRHYVDHSVVRRPNGTWLAIAVNPSVPGEGVVRQRIYVGTSKNGLDWACEPNAVVSHPTQNAFDPEIVALGGDRYRIYYSLGLRGFEGPSKVLSGVLRR